MKMLVGMMMLNYIRCGTFVSCLIDTYAERDILGDK